ncbi:MAG: DUF805 domain-containing protein [Pseudomonadota bacterium]
MRGRASRREYAVWIGVITVWLSVAAWAGNPWTPKVLSIALFLQTIRRLHDLGRTGGWLGAFFGGQLALAALPASYPGSTWSHWAEPIFTLAYFMVIAALPGSDGENRFGPPPRARRRDSQTVGA